MKHTGYMPWDDVWDDLEDYYKTLFWSGIRIVSYKKNK